MIVRVPQKPVLCTMKRTILFLCFYAGTQSSLLSQTNYPKEVNLEEVVVTGQFQPGASDKSIHRIRSIDKKLILQKGATRIEDVLNAVIGFRMKQDGVLGETDFELMGAGGNSVKVLLDGIPLVDRGENKQSLSQIDISTVERIEIVEGPMSVLYGTDALSGVVNIITKKGEKNASNPWKVQATVHEESIGSEYEALTGKGLHRQSVSASYNHKGKIHTQAGVSRLDNGGWQGLPSESSQAWHPKEQLLLHGVVAYEGKLLQARYRLDYTAEEITPPDQSLQSQRANHQLHLSYKPNEHCQLENAASWQNYHRDTYDQSQWKDNTTYSLLFDRLTALWIPTPNLQIQSGWEFLMDNGRGERIDHTRSVSSHSLFLSAQYNFSPKLQVRAGLRGVLHSDYEQPKILPSVHVKCYLTEDVSLRLSYAQGFRAPKLRELYFNFYDTNHDMIGNPNLKPEKSQNLMAGLSWNMLRSSQLQLKSNLSGFYNRFTDRILMVPSSQKVGQFTYENIEEFRTTGITWQNQLGFRNFSIDLSAGIIGRYMVFNASTPEADQLNQFRFSPEATVSANYSFPQWKAGIALFYKYTGKRYNYYSDAQLKYVLEGSEAYHWADLTLHKQMGKYVNLQLGAKNLLDVTTVFNNTAGGHASSSQNLIGSGRSYFCAINVTIH